LGNDQKKIPRCPANFLEYKEEVGVAPLVMWKFLAAVAAQGAPNMNGFPYQIANPNANGLWTGEYAQIDPSLQYFDVYSPPIVTRYAQVFWTSMDAVPIPADVAAKFSGKTMAIRGYECNQVMKSKDGDIPVPISAAYNHHHNAIIKSKHAELRKFPATPEDVEFSHGASEVWKAVDMRPPNLRTGPASVTLHVREEYVCVK
jgi:hypothetical protein